MDSGTFAKPGGQNNDNDAIGSDEDNDNHEAGSVHMMLNISIIHRNDDECSTIRL